MATTNSRYQLSGYLIDKTIGKGTFGKVKRARHRQSGEPVAIKILEKDKIKDITDVERVARELHILKLVRHSAIAQLYEVIETPTTIYIVMEYAAEGEFFEYIMDGKIRDETQAHHYFEQIVSGLDYLHRLHISHRDVKPENMLLDVQNRLKIVDFGLSNMYAPKEPLTTACGSPCYASPEMIRGQPYDPELTDVWSLGIVLFTMVFAQLPFEDDNTSVLYSKIKNGVYVISHKVSPELKDLLSKLINVQPTQRLRMNQIKQHPWCQRFKATENYGIHVGFDRIPVDLTILRQMESHGYSSSTTRKHLEFNLKNSCTATYYLFLKKNFKLGIPSPTDICSHDFDRNLSKPAPKSLHRRLSLDFRALAEKEDEAASIAKSRKMHSQPKAIYISDMQAKGNGWTDTSGFTKSLSRNQKQFQIFNFSSHKRNEPLSSSLEKKKVKKYKLPLREQTSASKNNLRRLRTDHVREEESVQRERFQLNISDTFWKKRTAKEPRRGPSRSRN